MGDRAQVEVIDNRRSVFLYTHWRGSELPRLVQKVMQRHKRWDDSPYLTRMLFCGMLDGELDDETGFGISTSDGAGDRTLTVNCDKQTISWNDHSVSFEEFCNIPNITWRLGD